MKLEEALTKAIDDKKMEEILKFVRKRYTLTDVRYVDGEGIYGISEMGHGIPYIIFMTRVLIVQALTQPDFRSVLGDLDALIRPYENGEECKKEFLQLVNGKKSYIQK